MMENLQGTTLGRYHLDTLLGRGNRASVYQAKPISGGISVAVRVFDRDLSVEPQFTERFRRNAETLAAISHKHILPIIEHDEQDGMAYLVRPYVSGGALRRLLGSPLPLAEVLRLLRPVADALDHAHAAGVIHGDVKPGNILLPRAGEVILADLGIADLLPRGNSLLMAAKGRSYGTPEYLSPEQAHALTLDGKTDQYALGVIAYEALVGRTPFRAEGPDDTPRSVAARHITMPPPNPRRLNPLISPLVERALLRALDKDPLRRFPSCLDFIDALAAALPQDVAPVGILALPNVAGSLSPTAEVPPLAGKLQRTAGDDFVLASDTAPFQLDVNTESLAPGPSASALGTILLPARTIESGELAEEATDPLERLAAHHAAEMQVLSDYFENQMAMRNATVRELETTLASLSRQLAEAREKQEQLATEVSALRREREMMRSKGRAGRPAPAASAPLAGQALGQLTLHDSHLHGLPHGTSLTLTPGAMVGRHPDSEILLDDAFVSAHHAQFTLEDDGWWVMDLNTKNGTFVNGKSITMPTHLKPGDLVRFGRVRANFT